MNGVMESPLSLLLVLGILSLAPFLLIMVTSFVKISVVLSILRNAIGTQQIPPNQVITGMSFVLSSFVMAPVAEDIHRAVTEPGPEMRTEVADPGLSSLVHTWERAQEPLRVFLSRHAHDGDRALFVELATHLQTNQLREVDPESFKVLVPSFVLSELKEGFQMGFLLFVPFLIVDMVVANILLSLGMMMLSPTVISLPFKLLLFVLANGWTLLVKGLVLTYV